MGNRPVRDDVFVPLALSSRVSKAPCQCRPKGALKGHPDSAAGENGACPQLRRGRNGACPQLKWCPVAISGGALYSGRSCRPPPSTTRAACVGRCLGTTAGGSSARLLGRLESLRRRTSDSVRLFEENAHAAPDPRLDHARAHRLRPPPPPRRTPTTAPPSRNGAPTARPPSANRTAGSRSPDSSF